MERLGGWTVITPEENNNAIALDPNYNVSSIKDNFEAIGEFERKCRLCSSTVKITPRSKWNMNRHFKKQHSIEWAGIEAFSKTIKPQVHTKFIQK